MCSEDNIYNISEYPPGQNIHNAARQVHNSMGEQLTDQSDSKDCSKWCYTVLVASCYEDSLRLHFWASSLQCFYKLYADRIQAHTKFAMLGGIVEFTWAKREITERSWQIRELGFLFSKNKVPDSAPAMEQPWLYVQTGGWEPGEQCSRKKLELKLVANWTWASQHALTAKGPTTPQSASGPAVWEKGLFCVEPRIGHHDPCRIQLWKFNDSMNITPDYKSQSSVT